MKNAATIFLTILAAGAALNWAKTQTSFPALSKGAQYVVEGFGV